MRKVWGNNSMTNPPRDNEKRGFSGLDEMVSDISKETKETLKANATEEDNISQRTSDVPRNGTPSPNSSSDNKGQGDDKTATVVTPRTSWISGMGWIVWIVIIATIFIVLENSFNKSKPQSNHTFTSTPSYTPKPEWIEVGSNTYMLGDDYIEITAFADPDTIRKMDNITKMRIFIDKRWVKKINYKQKKLAKPQASIVGWQAEFECKKAQSRSISHEWAPVSPDSIDEKLWKFACGK